MYEMLWIGIIKRTSRGGSTFFISFLTLIVLFQGDAGSSSVYNDFKPKTKGKQNKEVDMKTCL